MRQCGRPRREETHPLVGRLLHCGRAREPRSRASAPAGRRHPAAGHVTSDKMHLRGSADRALSLRRLAPHFEQLDLDEAAPRLFLTSDTTPAPLRRRRRRALDHFSVAGAPCASSARPGAPTRRRLAIDCRRRASGAEAASRELRQRLAAPRAPARPDRARVAAGRRVLVGPRCPAGGARDATGRRRTGLRGTVSSWPPPLTGVDSHREHRRFAERLSEVVVFATEELLATLVVRNAEAEEDDARSRPARAAPTGFASLVLHDGDRAPHQRLRVRALVTVLHAQVQRGAGHRGRRVAARVRREHAPRSTSERRALGLVRVGTRVGSARGVASATHPPPPSPSPSPRRRASRLLRLGLGRRVAASGSESPPRLPRPRARRTGRTRTPTGEHGLGGRRALERLLQLIRPSA